MRRKILPFLLCITFLLTGCEGRSGPEKNVIADNTVEGQINYETSTFGINSKDKKFEKNLISGTYYVVHDGIYYPLYYYGTSYEEAAPDKGGIDPKRQMYYTTENEVNIPTVFKGDSIVYYSKDSLLDVIYWERFYDWGYTIGLFGLESLKNGRYYIDISDDNFRILPTSELADMKNLGASQILIDKIGGTQITKKLVDSGMITDTQKSKSYDLEVYTGTQFKHYVTTANMHAFRAYELYASVEYTTLQDRFYEIKIPDYFVDGYYNLGNQGLFRYVTGESYSEETDFNEQLLYPTPNRDDPEAYVAPAVYSSFEPLNQYTTSVVGTLGYISEEDYLEKVENEKEEDDTSLQEAFVKTIDLYFPDATDCKIEIKSKNGESTGDITLMINGKTKTIDYNGIDDIYSLEFSGNGTKGTLTISGFKKKYEVILTGCEVYTNQLEVQKETSENKRKE